jgi:hypothetical protein
LGSRYSAQDASTAGRGQSLNVGTFKDC